MGIEEDTLFHELLNMVYFSHLKVLSLTANKCHSDSWMVTYYLEYFQQDL